MEKPKCPPCGPHRKLTGTPKPIIRADDIYLSCHRIGGIDHDNVVFLVDRKYEADVRVALRSRFGEREVEFIY